MKVKKQEWHKKGRKVIYITVLAGILLGLFQTTGSIGNVIWVRAAAQEPSVADTTRESADLPETKQEPADVLIPGKDTEQTTTEETVKDVYQIKYVLYGGKNAAQNPNTFQIEKNKSVALQPAQKDGYAFTGWYLDKNLQKKVEDLDEHIEKQLPDDKNTAKKIIYLYAKYTLYTYDISYETYGAFLPADAVRQYTVESNPVVLPVITKPGYTFLGWHDNPGLTGSVITTIPQKSYGNKRYYAAWSRNTYSISYNLNGGEAKGSNPAAYTIASGPVYLESPVRAGYTFSGWYTDAAFQNKITQIEAGTAQNIELFAKWKKVSAAKVKKVTLKNKKDKLYISFAKVSRVSGYEIVYTYPSGKKRKTQRVNVIRPGYTLLKCKKNKKYSVKVRGFKYDSTNQKIYGSYSKTYKCKIR